METRNPYFKAVEARTEEEADHYFKRLVREAMEANETLELDHAKEQVVAGLSYVAGYYGEDARGRVARFYSHRSPYRNG